MEVHSRKFENEPDWPLGADPSNYPAGGYAQGMAVVDSERVRESGGCFT
jgi:hypothetical protein